MSALTPLYILHQAVDRAPMGGAPATNANFSLSLQADGWRLGTAGQFVRVGDTGSAGQWHTLKYRLEMMGDNAHVEVVLDDGQPVPLDLTGGGGYQAIQLGPYWAPTIPSAGAVTVDYDDVTAWDCSK